MLVFAVLAVVCLVCAWLFVCFVRFDCYDHCIGVCVGLVVACGFEFVDVAFCFGWCLCCLRFNLDWLRLFVVWFS